jgi:hypothetical protein
MPSGPMDRGGTGTIDLKHHEFGHREKRKSCIATS